MTIQLSDYSTGLNSPDQAWHHKLVSKYGKAKALSIIAQKLGRAVYIILKRRTAFDAKRFYDSET